MTDRDEKVREALEEINDLARFWLERDEIHGLDDDCMCATEISFGTLRKCSAVYAALSHPAPDVPEAEEIETIRARHEACESDFTSGNVMPMRIYMDAARTDRATLLRLLDAERARRVEVEGALDRAQELLAEIGDTAHHASAGPTVPDTYWDIRSLAYSGVDLATHKDTQDE